MPINNKSRLKDPGLGNCGLRPSLNSNGCEEIQAGGSNGICIGCSFQKKTAKRQIYETRELFKEKK